MAFSCGWCNGTTGHNPWCQAPKVDCNARGEPEYWTIRLNKYQRDNLLWLFAAAGYFSAVKAFGLKDDESPVQPFDFANTGDWTGEIPNMLTTVDSPPKPNRSIQELRTLVEQWVVAAKVHLT